MDPAVRAAVTDPQRVATLHASQLLDTPPEEAFDRFTRLAAHLVSAPVVLFTLVDADRQFFKSVVGLPEAMAARRGGPLSHSFCKYVVASGLPLVAEDTLAHPLVRECALSSELGVRAYAGMPVHAPDGSVLGSFCALDLKPRPWTPEQIACLTDLAAALSDQVGLRYLVVARRGAEEKLLAERDFVGRAFDAVDALLAVVGDNGAIRRANAACARLVQCTPDDLRGLSFVDVLVPDANAEEVAAGLERLLRGEGERLDWQGEWPGPEGHRFVSWSATVMQDRGRCYVLASGQDRTARRRLEERFESILRAATENSIIGCTPDGVIEIFNAGAEHMLGYTAAEVVGRETPELFHDREEVRRRARELRVEPGFQVFVAAARRGEAETREWTYIRKDGRRLRVSLSVTATRDEDGRVTGFIGIANDVSEQRRTEEAVRLLHGLSTTMAQAEDFESALEVALAEICHLTGWVYGEVWLPRPKEGVLERSPIYYYTGPEEVRAFVRETEGFRFRPGEGLPGVVWARGEPVWVPDVATAGLGQRSELALKAGLHAGLGVPVLAGDDLVAVIVFAHHKPRAEDEQLVQLISTVAAQLGAVMLRKQAEEALQKYALQVGEQAELLELANDAIFVLSMDGRLRYWNRGAERLYGWTREEALGRSATELLATRFPAPESVIRRQLLSVGRWEGELTHTTRDGRELVVSSRWAVQRGLGGEPTGVLEFNTDVTARRRAELALVRARQEAEEANRAKSDFLARMSHELRTPLNSVIGFTNILLKNKGGNLRPQELTFLERIAANGKHLLELINDILDLSKIEARKMELVQGPVGLADLVAEIEAQLARPAEGVQLVTAVPEGLEDLHTDRAKLKQVILNLLSNALKFTERGNVTLRIVAEPAGRPQRIEVADTGIGIAADRLDAVFGAFQQAESGTSRKYGGTGLGLAISRSLCHLLGCDLTVRSEVGVGSVFSIVLPPVESAAAAAGAPAAEPAAAGGSAPPEPSAEVATAAAAVTGDGDRLALVVDVDEVARRRVAEELIRLGYRVASAASDAEGLRLARELRPDFITLQLRTPAPAGWDLIGAVRNDPQLAGIPVLIVSVSPDPTGRIEGVATVASPVTKQELVRVLALIGDGATHRILIVDDDADTRALEATLLREIGGCELRMAGNGREALAVLEAFVPDLILLDLLMPEMDGFALLEHMQTPGHAVMAPVVVVTARDLTAEEEQRLGRLTAAIIHKSQDFERDLRQIVTETLAPPARG